jgi:hypothetical protein
MVDPINSMVDRVSVNLRSGIRVYTIDHLEGGGITFQDLENEDAWLSAKNGLDLRKWA